MPGHSRWRSKAGRSLARRRNWVVEVDSTKDVSSTGSPYIHYRLPCRVHAESVLSRTLHNAYYMIAVVPELPTAIYGKIPSMYGQMSKAPLRAHKHITEQLPYSQ